ncbi:MAG: quinol dehydrogenase ferredoxin subunit NapH [Comamonadaceae bacterium]|nr:quinol dehydrogenase ferredoxin subunit NapH [Comamonadaceae bacterium]
MEALVGAVIVAVFFAALGGRVFCGWVCPVNVVTDLAGWLGGRLGTGTLSDRVRSGRSARYWILAASLVLSTILGVAAFEWISPISLLHRGLIFGMGMGWTAVLGIFLFDFIIARNGFCGHLCPLGAFYGIIGGRGIIRVYHDWDKCTMCMKCVETCPERQVLPMVGKDSAFVLQAECTNCARCIEVCGDGAMEFHTRFYKKNVIGKEENHA